ncbi:uncharacterized protein BDV14DRAFT_202459 [Aspergillus stella-maris]|uniref:uncharacterized protein n=1 Tax=Aspergillus stella-maris TaxID=1810926 RepID=UPI003CCDC37B
MPTNSTLFPFPRTPGSRTHLGEILNRPSHFHYNRLHPDPIEEMDIDVEVDPGYVADADGSGDTGFDNDNDADVYNYDYSPGNLQAGRGGASILSSGQAARERVYTPYRDDTPTATPPAPEPPSLASTSGPISHGSASDPIVITDADTDMAHYTDSSNPLRLKRTTFESGAGETLYDPDSGAYESVLDIATGDGGFVHHREVVSEDGIVQAGDVVRGQGGGSGTRVRRVVGEVDGGVGVVRDYER